ncbi:hypothetical protein C2E21_0666 [Chlorella sorokiniana]|uniref:Uncharacterized protein n=1 Tax=Chlorella sorokiniana TaxID=3076 RepID=A0A2P6U564_CHLSO|nr:hypothetical protein C2E21_0666 [Chlorella sorokiniana]|eukprot:PRW61466.1 hypothetical protein C2E21_0666 [Chlorella sorokiniana]
MWGDVADWMRCTDDPEAEAAAVLPLPTGPAAPLLHPDAGPASAALWVPDGLPGSPTVQDLDALLLPQPVQAQQAASSVPPLPWWPDSPLSMGAPTAAPPTMQLPAAAMQPDLSLASMLALPTAAGPPAAGSGASSLGSFELAGLDVAALAGTTGGNSCAISSSPLQARRAQQQAQQQQAQQQPVQHFTQEAQQQQQQQQQQQVPRQQQPAQPCGANGAAAAPAQQQERRPLSPQACLFAAVKQRRHVLVRRLLALGAPPNFCGVDVSLRCAAALTAAGIPVAGSEHLTPLMLAVQQLDATSAALLLSHGAALRPGPEVGGGAAYCRPLLLQLVDALAGAAAGAAAAAAAVHAPSAAVSGSSSDSGSGSITAACSSGSEGAAGGGGGGGGRPQPADPSNVLAAARSVLEALLQHGADPLEQDPHRPANFLTECAHPALLRLACSVALFGVASRWLQTKASPPIPALRLLLVVSLLAFGTLLALDALSLAAALACHAWRRCCRPQQQQQRQRQRQRQRQHRQHATAEDSLDVEAGSGGSAAGSKAGSDGKMEAPPEGPLVAGEGSTPAAQDSTSASSKPAAQDSMNAGSGAAAHEEAVQRPDIPLRRGLSRRLVGFEAQHPRAYRVAAAGSIAVSMALAGGCQAVAPGFVDAAIVQLVNSFGVLLVVVIQAALLRHRLPLLIWPCALVMTGGAVMVIVPSIGKGERGGLDSGRAWLGFGLSVVSMLAATCMYITLQAFRRLKFTGKMLQYIYLSLTIVVALPLTLPIDGTDWAAQFGGWSGGDWAWLVCGGTVVYVGQNYLLQHTTWQLGAPMVSLFYGLRLVASIIESKIVLSYTVITTGVQIAGAVLTVASVTVYMAYQYMLSRRQAPSKQEATNESAPASDCSAAANDGGQPGAACSK